MGWMNPDLNTKGIDIAPGIQAGQQIQSNDLKNAIVQQGIQQDMAARNALAGWQPGQANQDVIGNVMQANPKLGIDLQNSMTQQQARGDQASYYRAHALQAVMYGAADLWHKTGDKDTTLRFLQQGLRNQGISEDKIPADINPVSTNPNQFHVVNNSGQQGYVTMGPNGMQWQPITDVQGNPVKTTNTKSPTIAQLQDAATNDPDPDRRDQAKQLLADLEARQVRIAKDKATNSADIQSRKASEPSSIKLMDDLHRVDKEIAQIAAGVGGYANLSDETRAEHVNRMTNRRNHIVELHKRLYGLDPDAPPLKPGESIRRPIPGVGGQSIVKSTQVGIRKGTGEPIYRWSDGTLRTDEETAGEVDTGGTE